jgi:hypothetical protein
MTCQYLVIKFICNFRSSRQILPFYSQILACMFSNIVYVNIDMNTFQIRDQADMNPLYVNDEYKQRVDISANLESKFGSELIIHFL